MRRLLLCVLAALLALVAGCGADAAAPADASNDASNMAKAQATADRLIARLRMPPGSKRVTHSPVRALAKPHSFVSPSDPSLQRTAWWRVPLSLSALETWLTGAHEPGLTPSGDGTGGELEFSAAGSAAYTTPWLVLEYVATSRGTAVRADTFFAARYARASDTYARSVSAIGITRTSTNAGSSASSPLHLTQPTTVAEVVRAFNRLAGASTVIGVSMCPPPMPPTYDYRITFHGAGGDLVAELDPNCVGSLTVWSGSHQLGHGLDRSNLGDVVTKVYRDATSTSTLVGQVLWAGGPAPGAAVPRRGTVHVTGNGVDREIATDDQGRWRLALAPGRYSVRATSPGYGSRHGRRDACRTVGSREVTVRAGTTTANVYCDMK